MRPTMNDHTAGLKMRRWWIAPRVPEKITAISLESAQRIENNFSMAAWSMDANGILKIVRKPVTIHAGHLYTRSQAIFIVFADE